MQTRFLILGCVVALAAGEVEKAAENENTVICMTAASPVQAAEKASKQAYAAASTRSTEVATAADADYTKAVAAAASINTATLANALVQKTASIRAANLKKGEMVAQANARAKAELAEKLEKIADLRREAEQRVVATTHQKMQAIKADHQATIDTEKQDLLKTDREVAKAAHDKKAGSQNTELAATKQRFADANTEHESALQKAFTAFVIGKHQAEIDSAATKKTIEDRATKMQTDEKKIIDDTYVKQTALAQSESDAALAAASAKKSDMLASAQAEVKQAEMQAWVDTMSKEMDHNKLCNGDALSQAGIAASAGKVAAHEAKTGWAMESGNSAINDMGHNENAAISLAHAR